MADTNGNTPDPLIERLAKRPYAFDFYRAVRLLESQRPELPRMGFSISPEEDPVRFWQNPSLRFAPASLDSVRPGTAETPPRMAVNFFGLFGPNAPLPPHITEYVMEREMHHHDHTITAFFNVFHHRLISLFYRAWASSQKAVDLDRPEGQRFATYIGSLFGIGMDALQGQDAVPDKSKLFFTGRLSSQTRNREGLEAILREYFHLQVQLEPFIGRWLHLPEDSLWQLGGGSAGSRFGFRAVGGRFGELAAGGRYGGLGAGGGGGYDDSTDSGNKSGEAGTEGAVGGFMLGGVSRRAGLGGGSGDDTSVGRLGIDTILGSQFWDCQLSFRMRFGPMSLEDYMRMLPNGESFKRLKDWVLNYCGEHFFWSVQLVLLAAEVPMTRLGQRNGLGWTTWLKTKDFAHDADDLILHPPND